MSRSGGGTPRTDAESFGVLPALTSSTLWTLMERLSESGAPFNPSGEHRNPVSNERGMQRHLRTLTQPANAGAYVGVGPEQNLTYVTALRPSIAFIVDVQRKNWLLHLMYKALAEESTDRVDYLSRLFARPIQGCVSANTDIRSVLARLQCARRSDAVAERTASAIVARLRDHHAFRLSPDDAAGIVELYDTFTAQGPGIRRDPTGAPWIPSYAELMGETDDTGTHRSFVASDTVFGVLRAYHLANRIVPLIGDFSGSRTLGAVARYLRRTSTPVRTLYLSNVEQYVPACSRSRFVTNVAALPRDPSSKLLRTRFLHTGYTNGRPDYQSTTVTERIDQFVQERPDGLDPRSEASARWRHDQPRRPESASRPPP